MRMACLALVSKLLCGAGAERADPVRQPAPTARMAAATASLIHLPRRKAYTELIGRLERVVLGSLVPIQTSSNIELSRAKINPARAAHIPTLLSSSTRSWRLYSPLLSPARVRIRRQLRRQKARPGRENRPLRRSRPAPHQPARCRPVG